MWSRVVKPSAGGASCFLLLVSCFLLPASCQLHTAPANCSCLLPTASCQDKHLSSCKIRQLRSCNSLIFIALMRSFYTILLFVISCCLGAQEHHCALMKQRASAR